MVTLSKTQGASASARGYLRPMQPLRDWSAVAELMRVAFQSDVTHPSLPILPDWSWLRWLHPVLNFLAVLGMEMPEQMLGHVWEEDGRIVGNATLGLGHTRNGVWLLSNVAVHPSYRRRGIARALVETAIAEARRHGGAWLTLQVKSDNFGARDLYTQLGFRSLEAAAEFGGANVQVAMPAARDARLVRPTREQWQAVQAIASRHLPPALEMYRHSLSGLFNIPYRRSWLAQAGELCGGMQHANWSLLRGECVIGGMIAQTQLSWGTHRVGFCVAASEQGRVEELLLAQALQQIQPLASRRVNFIMPASYQAMIEFLRWRGLRELRTLELMGLEL